MVPPPGGSGASSGSGESRQRGKPRGMRRDRDCHSCKLRNVKCDLNRPSCAQCIEAGIPCAGYPQRVIWAGDRSAPATAKEAAAAPTKPQQQQHHESPLSQVQLHQYHPPQSIRTSTSTSPNTVHSSPLSARDGVAASKSPAEIRHSTSTTPREYVSPRQDDHQFSNEEHSFVSDIVNFCRHIIRATEGMSPEQGSSLSAEASSLITELHELMNVRLQSMNSDTPGEDEAWESIETTRHRLGTIIGLNEAVESANPFAILGIAAFALLEVHEGPFGEWQRHLQGARSLLDHHCRNAQELTELSATVTGLVRIVYQLVWLDTVGALARGTTGLIFDDWHRDMLDAEYLRTMACEPDTFALFNTVAKGEMIHDPLNGAMLALDQLAKIDLDTSQRVLATNVNRYGATLAALVRLPEAALPTRQSALSSTVERMCIAIDAMEPTSPFYIHVAVPVYLAGMFAETTRECNVVRTYYTNCRITGGRYLDALAKCSARWRSIGLG